MLRSVPPRIRTANTATARIPEKTAEPYYLTPAHKAWRRQVIAAARGACQHCGRTGTRLYADHIHELRDGGALDGPGQALCGACHTAKTVRARAARYRG